MIDLDDIFKEFDGLDALQCRELASKRIYDLLNIDRTEFLKRLSNGDYQYSLDPNVHEAMHYLPFGEMVPCECGATFNVWNEKAQQEMFEPTMDNVLHSYEVCIGFYAIKEY